MDCIGPICVGVFCLDLVILVYIYIDVNVKIEWSVEKQTQDYVKN